MRMKKGFSDPPRRFRPDKPVKHNGRIGPSPKPGPKRAVNVSIDAEILQVAKEMKINLSQAFEDTLRELTQEERERRFKEEIKPFVDSHNALIERIGIFGEELLDLDDPPV
jgi:antitoxin CcdA